MGRVSNAIVIAGGSIERIESHYPNLEEMLVKIGAWEMWEKSVSHS